MRKSFATHLGPHAPRVLGLCLLSYGLVACGDALDELDPTYTGSAGRPATQPQGGGGGAMMPSGGGAGTTSDAGAADDDGADPSDVAAPGETGIFVGATAAHNAVRAELELPELTWSNDLAAVAQDWAETLAQDCGSIGHRPNGNYGENIAARSSSGISLPPMSPEQAVRGWADEVECWTYGAIQRGDSCDTQCIQALNSTGCGHYTQLVWRDTRRVGCGYETCQAGNFLVEIWVCNYDPPGNIIGRNPY